MHDDARSNATTNPPAANADNPPDPLAMLATLQITRTQQRSHGSPGGVWVNGVIAGHLFEALVFPEHAESESYELGDSRISKLWVCQHAKGAPHQLSDNPDSVLWIREHDTGERREVACFDRGWDREPTTPAAKAIVDLLAAGLAERIFGK